MSYGEYPPNRMSYDIDGSLAFSNYYDYGLEDYVAAAIPNSTLVSLNTLQTEVLTYADLQKELIISFTELRHPRYCRVYTDGGGTFNLAYSRNRITSVSEVRTASWYSDVTYDCATSTGTRDHIRTVTVLVASGSIRLRGVTGASPTAGLRSVHLFGPAVSSHRLMVWDHHRDQPLSTSKLDWGDVSRGDSRYYPFRIRNLSDTYSASGVIVSVEDIGAPAVPSVASQHFLSMDTLEFTSTVNVGDIAPGGVSDIVYIMRAVAPTAQLGLWPFRVLATASGWTG